VYVNSNTLRRRRRNGGSRRSGTASRKEKGTGLAPLSDSSLSVVHRDDIIVLNENILVFDRELRILIEGGESGFCGGRKKKHENRAHRWSQFQKELPLRDVLTTLVLDLQPLLHRGHHPHHLGLKVGGVVNEVIVRMAHPDIGGPLCM